MNARRPFSAELESNLDMIEKVTGAGRIEIDALVNNTNLSQETSVQEPLDGYKMLRAYPNGSICPCVSQSALSP